MRRFIKNLALFALPFIIVVLVFFAFEPYDYFGLRGDAIYLSKPLSTMREVMRDRPTKLVFGDSRMANLNADYIEEISGERYTMMAFGGSTLGEQVELFRFATRYAVPEKVVFGVSFYMCRGTHDAGRIPAVEAQAESPWKFATNFSNWMQAADAIRWKSKNLINGALGRDELLEYPEDPTDYTIVPEITTERTAEGDRADLAAYAVTIYGGIVDYKLDDSTLALLGEVIDYCDANDTELIFVIPPMHETVFRRATEPAGAEPAREELLEFLKARATVYDLEFVNDYTLDENNFYDGFHLMPEQKKTLARLVFTDTDEHPEAIRRYIKD